MSWLQRLTETYDACVGRTDMGAELLAPLGSVPQKTQLHIALWEDGSFRHAELSELENTLMFVTEDSAGRSGKAPAPNPLTEQLEYCASGIEKFGGDPTKFERYSKLLSAWVDSGLADSKVHAVRTYIQAGTLLDDLIGRKVLRVEEGFFAKVKVSKALKLDPAKLWVRWSVSGFGLQEETWSDRLIADGWAKFDGGLGGDRSVCMLSGDLIRTTQKHPKRIRHSGDGAKLISSNDDSGYTYKGRFLSNGEALTIGYLSTQKAHNALRWLIARQASRNGDQVVVAWATQGAMTPPLLSDTLDFLDAADEDELAGPEAVASSSYKGDAGQEYALRLAKAVQGYRKRLDNHNKIVVMALDSATPGRMAILFYRELPGSEFLDRLERWHRRMAWPQNFGKGHEFIGAPAPRDIARAAYGKQEGDRFVVDERILQSTVERLLPCIVDRTAFPRELTRTVTARAICLGSFSKLDSTRYHEFNRSLGIACALIKGSMPEEDHHMALDENRTTRSYLYGRLLAIAETIERRALRLTEDERETAANRYFQNFADRPFETWKTISNCLKPYESKLRSSGKKQLAFLTYMDNLRNEIGAQFEASDFSLSRTRLDAEFLLGYYCQRAAFRGRQGSAKHNEQEPEGETE